MILRILDRILSDFLSAFTWLVIWLALAIVFFQYGCSSSNRKVYDTYCKSEWCALEGWCPPQWTPEPWTEDIDFPRYEHLILIGRLTSGVYKAKTYSEKTPFIFCGKVLASDEARDLSAEIAYHVVYSAFLASDERRQINPWGWAGLLSNESGFDLCALGTHPRRYAYKVGALKRKRRTVSHTKLEIISAMNHPRMRRFPAFDLGMGQTLDSYYPGPREDLLEWEGFYWQAEYLHSVAIMYRTNRPWKFWRGRALAKWKDARVTGYAKRLGAKEGEI